jgi:hypothetical protein
MKLGRQVRVDESVHHCAAELWVVAQYWCATHADGVPGTTHLVWTDVVLGDPSILKVWVSVTVVSFLQGLSPNWTKMITYCGSKITNGI